VKPVKVSICPQCGFKPERKSGVEVEDGELRELTDGKKKLKFTQADKQAWYSQLLHIAEKRGYKPGWAAHKFREKFKTWPAARTVTPLQPSAEVLAWVRSRDIAYAKARAKGRAA